MPIPNLPTSAYLYTLSLDGPARTWEYLRRNAGYRKDWRTRGAGGAVRDGAPWGLRFLG